MDKIWVEGEQVHTWAFLDRQKVRTKSVIAMVSFTKNVFYLVDEKSKNYKM